MHGNDDLGVYFLNGLSGLSRIDGINPANGHEKDVNRTDLSGFLLGENVTQVTQVADVHPVQGKAKDGILPPFGPFVRVVEGGNPFEFYILCFMGAGSFDDLGLSPQALDIVVIGVMMADQDDIRLVPNRAVPDGPAKPSWLIRIGDDFRALV
jgi:hypothetical protein